MTIDSVLANNKFPADHWIWHYELPEGSGDIKIDSDEKFAALALAHSARGCLVLDDRYPLESLVDVMIEEIAGIESDEFDASACHYKKVGREYRNSFVINDRLYKFNHREGPHGSDDRYSASEAVKILNAVCIRQNLDGRFRCFSTPWDITLTLYLTDAQASEVMGTFGLYPW